MPEARPLFRLHKRAPKQQNPNRTRGRKLQMLRESVFMEQPLCALCEAQGRVSPSEELDHIIPLSIGGGDERSNLQGLCKPCHAEKSMAERVGVIRK